MVEYVLLLESHAFVHARLTGCRTISVEERKEVDVDNDNIGATVCTAKCSGMVQTKVSKKSYEQQKSRILKLATACWH